MTAPEVGSARSIDPELAPRLASVSVVCPELIQTGELIFHQCYSIL